MRMSRDLCLWWLGVVGMQTITGQLRFVLGSVGGARIIGDVAQALVELLDWGVIVRLIEVAG